MIVFMQLPLLLLSLLRYLLGEKYPNPETKHHQMCYDEIKKKIQIMSQTFYYLTFQVS